ncbi:MAG: HD domain-containing protein [Deltaproteobacteria bacterium]|nr:HD domain-containing protein [Deltaproteobacteria bacterium]
MLENIRAHSIMVEKVAGLIGRGLLEAGCVLSLKMISAGALMHDIAKTPCLSSGGDHAAMGRDICLENHLDEIADIVAEHVVLKDDGAEGGIREKEIVYYADKRVTHDQVVSLEERLDYLLERYAKGKEQIVPLIMANFNHCKEVEAKIFAGLPFDPEDVSRLIG